METGWRGAAVGGERRKGSALLLPRFLENSTHIPTRCSTQASAPPLFCSIYVCVHVSLLSDTMEESEGTLL